MLKFKNIKGVAEIAKNPIYSKRLQMLEIQNSLMAKNDKCSELWEHFLRLQEYPYIVDIITNNVKFAKFCRTFHILAFKFLPKDGRYKI